MVAPLGIHGLEQQKNQSTSSIPINHSVARWCLSSYDLDHLVPRLKDLGIHSIDLVGPQDFKTLKKYDMHCSMCEGAEISLTEGFNDIFLTLGYNGNGVALLFSPEFVGTGFDLPDGEYVTVAGLVLDRLERIPEVGDSFTVDGIRVEVLAVDGFAIERIELRVDPEALADTDDDDRPSRADDAGEQRGER